MSAVILLIIHTFFERYEIRKERILSDVTMNTNFSKSSEAISKSYSINAQGYLSELRYSNESSLRSSACRSIILDLIVVAVAFVWSTRASVVFIGQFISEERKTLAVYPVFFFYVFLSWMILI